MPMIDMGHVYPSCDAPSEVDKTPRKDYPSIYMRGSDIPKFPEGKFYTVVELRVAGYRDPEDGEKSVDLDVYKMSAPVDEKTAMKVAATSYPEEETEEVSEMFTEDGAKTAFRESLAEVIKEGAIGQSA